MVVAVACNHNEKREGKESSKLSCLIPRDP